MDSAILLIFNSSKGAHVLSKENESDLFTRSVLILLLFGALIYICYLGDLTQTLGGALNTLLLIFVPIGVALYGYILSWNVFFIGKLLGSKMHLTGVNVLMSHSFIPLIIGFLSLVLLTKVDVSQMEFGSYLNTNMVVLVSCFFSLKILIVSIWKLGKINFFKAILSVLPTLIIPLFLAEHIYELFDWENIKVVLLYYQEIGVMYAPYILK